MRLRFTAFALLLVFSSLSIGTPLSLRFTEADASLITVGGGPGSGAPADPPAAEGTNEARIADIVNGRTLPHTINEPADPVTDQTINVTAGNFTSLQNAVSTEGALVNVPAGTYTGNLSLSADDVDVVCASGAEIVGDFNIGTGTGAAGRIDRVRVTGCDQSGGNLQLWHANDVLIDDVYFTTDDGNNEMSGWSDGTDDGWNRIAFINTTIDHLGTNSATGWAWFTAGYSGSERQTDLFLLNVKLLTNGSQNNRFQSINRMLVLDSSFNEDFGSANGFRLSWSSGGSIPATDVYFDNVIVNELWLMNYASGGSETIDVTGGVFNRVRRYHVGSFFDFAAMVSGNTGSISNSAAYGSSGTPPASLNTGPFTDGGGNSVGNYDGSAPTALPDGTLLTAVGAVR